MSRWVQSAESRVAPVVFGLPEHQFAGVSRASTLVKGALRRVCDKQELGWGSNQPLDLPKLRRALSTLPLVRARMACPHVRKRRAPPHRCLPCGAEVLTVEEAAVLPSDQSQCTHTRSLVSRGSPEGGQARPASSSVGAFVSVSLAPPSGACSKRRQQRPNTAVID
jgi:hypothetical protein